MRIVLLGAGGFIGRHIMAELLASGHAVVALVRRTHGLKAAFPDAQFVERNLAQAVAADDWAAVLRSGDIVVNAAGVLRGRDMWRVHVDMPKALHQAAERAGVARVVLISAISARQDVATDYAQAKLQGEVALQQSRVAWTILRPSLVYGDGSYGGTSLIRGMAGLPGFIPIPGNGDHAFTPIHARDLARSVRIVCEEARFAACVIEPVGPKTLSLKAILLAYRAWLGFGPARFIPVPIGLMRLLGRIGDWFGDGPVSTNSLEQTIAGNAGDSAVFRNAMGFDPRTLSDALRDRPAQVQDRWHARLFFLPASIRLTLIVLWLGSAIAGWLRGATETARLTQALHLPASFDDPLRITGSLLDIGIALLLITGLSLRLSTILQCALVGGYTLLIGIALPDLWGEPLGPLLKNLPILMLILVYGAIGDKRG